MGQRDSGDVEGRYSTRASSRAGKEKMPSSATPWSGGRPNEAGHTRKSSGGKSDGGSFRNPSDERPDSIYGGKQPGNTTAGKQRSDHK